MADLAEFDENIPLDQETEKEKEPEASKAEQEINHIIEKVNSDKLTLVHKSNHFLLFQLSPIEKYAMKFIEQTESAWSAEQLAAATRQIEEQKREWELNQMAAMREEEERRQRELEEENEMITYSREDATNQVSLKRRKHKFRITRTKTGVKVLKRKATFQSKVPKSKRLKRLVKRTLNSTNIESSSRPVTPEETEVLEDASNATGDDSSLDSVQSESDMTLSELKKSTLDNDSTENVSFTNHVDHNSPRTRSRGTVKINLWTLDVSPILPGVKPVKNNKISGLSSDKDIKKIPRKRKAGSDEEDKDLTDAEDDDKLDRQRIEQKNSSGIVDAIENETTDEMTENSNSDLPVCQIVLNDIMAEGRYKMSNNGEESEDSLSSSFEPNNSAESLQEPNSTKLTNGVKTKQEDLLVSSSLDSEVVEIVVKHDTVTVDDDDVDTEEKPKSNHVTEITVSNSTVTSFAGDHEEKSLKEEPKARSNENDVFISEYEKEFIESEKTKIDNCDSLPDTAQSSKSEIYVATYVNTNNGLSSNAVNKFRQPTPNASKFHRNFGSFKPPDHRKTYKKFSRFSGNQTLDGWVTRKPPHNQTDP